MIDRHEMLLNFVKKFNKICVDNDIEYFIGCGTALGAIRHKGFLPWDDDIDLIMKRDEYLRAKPIFKKVFPENWVIVDNDEFEGYNNPIARIVDTNSTEFTRSRLVDGTPHGNQLEIFLLDPIPASEINQGQYYRDWWLYCETKTYNFLVANKALNMEKFPIDEYLKTKNQEERTALANELEKKLLGYKEEDCDYYHFRWGIEWICYPKETFDHQVWVDFEDTVLPVANGYVTEFFTDYGDTWMMIPDVEDQQVHSTIENFNVPYKEYEKLLEKVIDYKKSRQSKMETKPLNVVKNYNDDMVRRLYLHHDNVRVSMKYAEGSELRTAAFEALENKDYFAAHEALEYFHAQQEKNFERYMLATRDMELLAAALETSFVVGDWRFIEKTRKIIVNKPELITEKIQAVFDIVAKARAAYFSQFYEIKDEHKETVVNVLAQYPDQVQMIEMKHMISCYDENCNKEECLKNIESLEDSLRERPTMVMLKIYCLLQLDRRNEAEELYENVRLTIKNGMVLNKLKELMGY